MTYKEARATGKVFARVAEQYSHIYYPQVTVSECSDPSIYDHWPGTQVDDVMVDEGAIDYCDPDYDDPDIIILGDFEQGSGADRKCTCDFYSVLLMSGCQCGGK